MDNTKKEELLLRNFKVLKEEPEKNWKTICEIIIKMFSLNSNIALSLWCPFIEQYEKEFNLIDFNNIVPIDKTEEQKQIWSQKLYHLTVDILKDIENTHGTQTMESVILDTPIIKRMVFSYNCRSLNLIACKIIKSKIENNNWQLADELLQLLYNIPEREINWYAIMNEVIPYCEISNETFNLLEKWRDKLDNVKKQDSLNLIMMHRLI